MEHKADCNDQTPGNFKFDGIRRQWIGAAVFLLLLLPDAATAGQAATPTSDCPPPGVGLLLPPADAQLACRNFVLGEEQVPYENEAHLTWSGGGSGPTETYDVYFGAYDAEGEVALERIATSSSSEHTVSVECSRSYAWMIVARNNCGTKESEVRRFQTLACTDTFPVWECQPPPVPDFTWNPGQPIAGQPVQMQFENLPEPGEVFEVFWDFDGDSDTPWIEEEFEKRFVFAINVFDQPGIYEVELKVKNPAGSSSTKKQVHVASSSPLSLPEGVNAFIGEPVRIEARATGCTPAAAGWTWDLASGEAVGDANKAAVLAGWSTILPRQEKVVVVRNSGCGSAVASTLVSTAYRIPISGPTAAQVGEPVELTATVPAECGPPPTGSHRFFWTDDSGTRPGPNPKTFVWDSPGRHFVEVYVDSCGAVAYGHHEVLVGKWIALGDSFSSGEGAWNYLVGTDNPGQNMCHRSSTAYSQVAVNLPETADEFFACSGAETENVIHADNGGAPKCIQGILPSCSDSAPPDDIPQLDHPEVASANLITITIGGNDVLFSDVLTWCYGVNDCENFTPHGWNETLKEALPRLIGRAGFQLERTLEATAIKAPFADVRVLGYPALFPSEAVRQACPTLADPGCFGAWSPKEQTWLNSLVPTLNQALAIAAANLGARFISVEEPFSGHEICGSRGSWFVPPPSYCIPLVFAGSELFHPTPTGHREGYRRALEADLQAVPIGSASAPHALKPQARESAADLPTLGRLPVKVIAPACGEVAVPGKEISVSGEGFAPGATVKLLLGAQDPQELKTVTADAAGSFGTTVTIPLGASPSVLAPLQAAGTGANLQPRALIAPITIGPDLNVDQDADGSPDACDVCPSAFDPEQTDSDGDFLGDACDTCPNDPLNDCAFGGYFTVTPCRIADTRSTEPPALSSGVKRIFQVAGRCGIPATAKAVSANVTVVGATGGGFVQAWPSDLQPPGTSTINFGAGQTRANNFILALPYDGGGDAALQAVVTGGGTVHVIMDVTGYFQ